MALLWIDGFDHLDQAHLLGCYEQRSSGANLTTNKRTGTRALSLAGTEWLEKWLAANGTLIVGLAIYLDLTAYPSTGNYIALYDAGTIQCTLQITSTGLLQVTRGGSTVLATSTVAVPLKEWHYIEFKVTIADAGSFEVRLDGRTVITGSGDTQNTANAYADRVRLSSPGSYTYFDDCYIANTSGTQNNNFLGDVKVVTVYPNADGTNTAWTPSSGTAHWSLVDEAPANDDTDYLYTSTVGATDTENFTDVSLTGSILGVMQLACIRKDDAGSREACLICRSGGLDYEGTQTAIGNTYTYLKQLRETDPATGLPWTLSGLNAAEFGVRMKL